MVKWGVVQVFKQLADSVDVTKEGVHGAAEFFQAKVRIWSLIFVSFCVLDNRSSGWMISYNFVGNL